MFTLDPKLENDCFFVTNLKLSKLLLMNDANYYWFILVPQKPNLVELIDLTFDEQKIILEEINQISKILKDKFNCDKINIATLGNVVKQLHIHVIGRFENDPSYPKPVWGALSAKEYDEELKNEIITKLTESL